MLCDFGCGNKAVKKFKSGRYCCSESTSKCPAMKLKNNQSKRYKFDWPEIQKEYNKGFSQREICKKFGISSGTLYNATKHGLLKLRDRRVAVELARSKGKCKLTEVAREKLANQARKNIIERYESGWLPKAGRCKKIKYLSSTAGEVTLDGTWELLVAKHLDKMEWHWKRNTKRFSYTNLNGKLSHYTPDFFVEELGGYLEVKGYETDLDRCKWAQFPEKLTVWKKAEINMITEGSDNGIPADC